MTIKKGQEHILSLHNDARCIAPQVQKPYGIATATRIIEGNDGVGSETGLEFVDIVSGTSVEHIVTATTQKAIIPIAGVDDVIAKAAKQHIVAAATDDIPSFVSPDHGDSTIHGTQQCDNLIMVVLRSITKIEKVDRLLIEEVLDP